MQIKYILWPAAVQVYCLLLISRYKVTMAWRLWIWKALLLAVAACELTGGENAPYDISYGFASDIDVKGIA